MLGSDKSQRLSTPWSEVVVTVSADDMAPVFGCRNFRSPTTPIVVSSIL
jgi:hypothetical protein